MRIIPPEYSPVHRWTDQERELLCCINRWYRRSDDFASIMNHIFAQDLPVRKVRNYFENHLRLFGPDAFPIYKAVFSVPFSDPSGTYDRHRELIEATAIKLNITLHRLSEEVISESGRAKTAKCRKTRELYRELVKRASRERALAVKAPIMQNLSSPAPVFGGIALRTDNRSESEYLVDSENLLEALPKLQWVPCAPQLAFRVFDAYSGTCFINGGFVAGHFTGLASKPNSQFPPPFDPDTADGAQGIKLTCSSHFDRSGGPSAWISVFTSLLETLTKGAQMSKPQIAIIDLSHPLLRTQHKVLRASEILRAVKNERLVTFANTKHHAELLCWSHIPQETILTTLSLHHLISLADTSPAVSNTLHLHEFQPARKTSAVATSLAAKRTTLDPNAATAIAALCTLFNVSMPRHIRDLVARLVDGWNIVPSRLCTLQYAACVFAHELACSVFSTEDVADAFLQGVQQGTAVLRYWDQRRGAGKRSRRTRT